MREYKYVCKDCKEHLTNSEDRLCEWCRDKKRVNSAQICIICGKRRTPARDGICYNCRPKEPKEPYKPGVPWKEALEWVELEYVILQARYDGLSFQEIAELTELSAEECADTLATLSSLFDFAHKRHNSGTPRMNFTSLTLSVQRFASWAATLDAYELRSGRHSRPSGRAHRRFNHRTARFRMPDDFSYG